MQVDFYQLSRDPVELVTALICQKARDAGANLLVVSDDKDQLAAISKALWDRQGAYLAHGNAGSKHADRQPILLSEACRATNGATMVVIADGIWRDEAGDFARAFLLFGEDRTKDARALWARLGGESDHQLRIFKQRGDGSWREGR